MTSRALSPEELKKVLSKKPLEPTKKIKHRVYSAGQVKSVKVGINGK